MGNGILKYGGSWASTIVPKNENFIGSALNGFSLCCTPIELLANDGSENVIATATGFFWKFNEQPHLVTNWHVISGKNLFTDQLNPNGYLPRRINYYGVSLTVESHKVIIQRQPYTLELDDDMINALSIPPTINGQALDIWGIPISREVVFGRDSNRTGFSDAQSATCFLNDHVGPRIVTNVGDDCFILGYPLRNYEGLMPPIWKRGSIASETFLGVEGRPIFLIDAATTAGMSGSPIIRKVTTFVADNKDIGALQEFASYELIGVYAGRLEGDPLSSVNIGYGWYKIYIEDVLKYYNNIYNKLTSTIEWDLRDINLHN
jgi:hypothetical protein